MSTEEKEVRRPFQPATQESRHVLEAKEEDLLKETEKCALIVASDTREWNFLRRALLGPNFSRMSPSRLSAFCSCVETREELFAALTTAWHSPGERSRRGLLLENGFKGFGNRFTRREEIETLALCCREASFAVCVCPDGKDNLPRPRVFPPTFFICPTQIGVRTFGQAVMEGTIAQCPLPRGTRGTPEGSFLSSLRRSAQGALASFLGSLRENPHHR